jgi:hypothetical protein
MDTTIEAAPVLPEPCAGFAGAQRRFAAEGHGTESEATCDGGSADDSLVCACGWLEHDHGELATARAVRRRSQPSSVLLERRAS